MNKSAAAELAVNHKINDELFILQFNWDSPPPKAGQFFMLKPLRSAVFLARPVSVFEYNAASGILKFLIAVRGKGTEELSALQAGEKVQLTGPLGNCWEDFLPDGGKAAFIGGGVGVAPLAALAAEKAGYNFHFFAGFKSGFRDKEEENAVLGNAANAKKLVITSEDGRNALNGKITDFFFDPASYDVVFGCGPVPMLRTLKKKCDAVKAVCFISMESRMACGTGACLGCTVRTKSGNRRCCKDGPIFPAWEVMLDE